MSPANPHRTTADARSGRRLIVNADDLGMSDSVTQGILAAHRHGIVTSASLLVRRSAARRAIELAAKHPALSLGLHVDLGEWAYDDDRWKCVYEVVDLTEAPVVAREIEQQLELFRQLTGHTPAHLDSHQHVHLHEPTRSILIKLSARLSVPLRHFSAQVRYCGAFYGQTGSGASCLESIGVESLLKIISQLLVGVTELACHPGLPDQCDYGDGMYVAERSTEFETLCDPRVRDVLLFHGVQLCSFGDLPSAALVAGRAS